MNERDVIRKRHSRISIVTFCVGLILTPGGVLCMMLMALNGFQSPFVDALPVIGITSGFFLCPTAAFFSDQVWQRKLLFSLLGFLAWGTAAYAVFRVFMVFFGIDFQKRGMTIYDVR
jgi:uncharacterized membrane protein YcfT